MVMRQIAFGYFSYLYYLGYLRLSTVFLEKSDSRSKQKRITFWSLGLYNVYLIALAIANVAGYYYELDFLHAIVLLLFFYALPSILCSCLCIWIHKKVRYMRSVYED